MRLTNDETEFLRQLVAHHLSSLQKEAKTIIDYPTPAFYAGEKKYEDFLKQIVEKLTHGRR